MRPPLWHTLRRHYAAGTRRPASIFSTDYMAERGESLRSLVIVSCICKLYVITAAAVVAGAYLAAECLVNYLRGGN